MGIKDRTILSKMYAKKLGKATVTGYCIKFKSTKDIHTNILKDAIEFWLEVSRLQ